MVQAQVKSKKWLLFLIVLGLLGSTSYLFAQEEPVSLEEQSEEAPIDEDLGYHLSEDGKQIIQDFSWDEVPYISKYVFTIEHKSDEGEWVQEIEPVETQTPSIEIALDAGFYRYKIGIFNILGLLDYETEWYDAEIIQTYQPEIRDVSPTKIYMEEEQDGVFTINGLELRPETQFEMSGAKGNGKVTAQIIEQDSKNRRVKIQFDPQMLDAITYTMTATNNGGLHSSFTPITVQFKKPVDFDVSAGIAPAIFLFDQTIPTYFNNYSVFPYMADARITLIPIKRRIGYFGFDVYGSYGFLGTSQLPWDNSFYEENGYSVTAGFLNTHVDFVYQKLLYKRKLMLDLHAGAGVVGFIEMQFKFTHDYESTPLTSLNLAADAGISLQYYFTNRLYMEAGCDFTYGFMGLFNSSQMQLGFIQPTFMVGWQF